MARMIKSWATRTLIATASAVFLGMIGYLAWREHVTFRPNKMDRASTCYVHGTLLQWERAAVIDALIDYDNRYLVAKKHFPLHQRGELHQFALPKDCDPARWRYAYLNYCTDCENTFTKWSRMSPEEQDRFAEQPVRYFRKPELALKVRGVKGDVSCMIGSAGCSLAMLDNLCRLGVRRFGEMHMILELDPGLVPEDAAPIIEVAERHGITNRTFRVSGKPSSP